MLVLHACKEGNNLVEALNGIVHIAIKQCVELCLQCFNGSLATVVLGVEGLDLTLAAVVLTLQGAHIALNVGYAVPVQTVNAACLACCTPRSCYVTTIYCGWHGIADCCPHAYFWSRVCGFQSCHGVKQTAVWLLHILGTEHTTDNEVVMHMNITVKGLYLSRGALCHHLGILPNTIVFVPAVFLAAYSTVVAFLAAFGVSRPYSIYRAE